MSVDEPRLELIVLGTGSPVFVDASRAGPSALVVHHRERGTHPDLFLVDAGRWVTQRLGQARRGWQHMAAVLFTHHHMDHTIGWSDVLMSGWQFGRRRPWRVIGPPHTAVFCQAMETAFSYDRERRLAPVGTDGAIHDVEEISGGGIIHDHGGLVITAAVVPHGNCEPSFAFRFDAGGRSIVISGDCSPSEGLVELAANCDVLLHEVVHRPSVEAVAGLPLEFLEDAISIHTTEDEVGKVAARAGARKLVLTHFAPPVFDADALAAAVRSDFDGELVLADDLTRA